MVITWGETDNSSQAIDGEYVLAHLINANSGSGKPWMSLSSWTAVDSVGDNACRGKPDRYGTPLVPLQQIFYDNFNFRGNFGGNNYIFEIKNAADLNLTADQKKQNVNSNGEYTLCLDSDHNEFNSLADGGACFFNSTTKYQWRVLTSCVTCDKTKPVEDPAGTPDNWQNFTTVAAPELLGVTDKNHKEPEPDPDWNGPDYIKNVDFCTAGLHWCAAKIEPSKLPFNQGVAQSLDYHLMISYDEGVTLNNIVDAAKAGDWWGVITKSASYLNIPGMGETAASQCHYLLVKQPTPDSPKVCAAEIVTPQGTLQKVPATEFSNSTDPNFNRGFFTKNLQYDWSLKRCFDNSNAGPDACQKNVVDQTATLKSQNYGQTWSFKTSDAANVQAPLLSSPPDDKNAGDQFASTPIGLPPTIAWKPQCGSNSFEYELFQGDTKLAGAKTISSQVTFVNSAPAANATLKDDQAQADIKLDTEYQWRVRGCWPSLAIQDANQLCGDNDAWSPRFSFRTTGRAPQGLKTDDNKPSYIPTVFGWDAVPGAKSYILDISSAQGAHITKIVPATDPGKPVTIQVLYPDLKPKQTYTWKVKTCADAAGKEENCGPAWSVKYSFATDTLPAPEGYSSPRYLSSLDSFPTHLAWNAVKNAAAYRVTMSYINEDSSSECPPSGPLFDDVTPINSYDPKGLSLACLGSYTWGVTSCFSAACNPDETGAGTTWKFFIIREGGKPNGLMVCGLRDDDPKTDWDERKPCEVGDLFKFLEKLINFLLFKVSFWLLPILAAITGGLFYTQVGGQDVMIKAKTMWKYIGIGYALLFFAWLLTTWTLQAFGYSGLWWKIL